MEETFLKGSLTKLVYSGNTRLMRLDALESQITIFTCSEDYIRRIK